MTTLKIWENFITYSCSDPDMILEDVVEWQHGVNDTWYITLPNSILLIPSKEVVIEAFETTEETQ